MRKHSRPRDSRCTDKYPDPLGDAKLMVALDLIPEHLKWDSHDVWFLPRIPGLHDLGRLDQCGKVISSVHWSVPGLCMAPGQHVWLEEFLIACMVVWYHHLPKVQCWFSCRFTMLSAQGYILIATARKAASLVFQGRMSALHCLPGAQQVAVWSLLLCLFWHGMKSPQHKNSRSSCCTVLSSVSRTALGSLICSWFR